MVTSPTVHPSGACGGALSVPQALTTYTGVPGGLYFRLHNAELERSLSREFDWDRKRPTERARAPVRSQDQGRNTANEFDSWRSSIPSRVSSSKREARLRCSPHQ